MQVRWNVEEARTLIRLYNENKTNIEIAKKLERTASSVAHKLYSLGLRREIGTNQTNFGMRNSMQGKKHSCSSIEKIREKAIDRFKNRENHPRWNGGKTINSNGYIRIRNIDHPRSVGGYVFEHIIVMEEIIGRFLNRREVVHHINMQKTDNRPENLMLFQNRADHARYHAFMKRKEVFNCE